MDTIHVYLSVFDFDPAPPALVSSVLGMEPTAAWTKGDAVPEVRGASRPFSTWRLMSPLPRTANFEGQLEALLGILETNAEGVRLATKRFGAQITCAAYFESVNPGFNLSVEHIQRIAALALSLDFDLYCLAGAGSAG